MIVRKKYGIYYWWMDGKSHRYYGSQNDINGSWWIHGVRIK